MAFRLHPTTYHLLHLPNIHLNLDRPIRSWWRWIALVIVEQDPGIFQYVTRQHRDHALI